jgi:hypothetical protein
MSTADLLVKFNGLPEDLRKQVVDLIDALLKRTPKPEPPKKKRPIGLMKGKIRMADDFDEPLEDMRPYME